MKPESLDIPITFVAPVDSGISRNDEPVTFGVPLPQGRVTPGQSWRLETGQDSRVVQSRPMDLWSDGSVRWMLVDALVSCKETPCKATLKPDTSGQSFTTPRVIVEETPGAIRVRTGAADFESRLGATFPFEGARATLTGKEGEATPVRISAAKVLLNGPLHAELEITGSIGAPGETGELEVSSHLHFFAGSPVVRISIRVRNPRAATHPGGFWDLGDAGSILIKDFSLHLQLPSEGNRALSYSSETNLPLTTALAPFELYQDSSGGENWQSPIHINRDRKVPVTFKGYRIRTGADESRGLRSTPIVVAGSGSNRLAVSIEHFWQNFPKAIEAGQDELTLSLFPKAFGDLHELQGGEQKTHVCFVARGDDRTTELPLDWTRNRLIAVVDAAWIENTEAVRWLSEDEPAHKRLIWSAIEGNDTFDKKREVVDEYGWRNFGDVYGDHEGIRHEGPSPLVSHYNNQYDPVSGFLYQFFRSGDARWWSMARELAAHVMDIDIYHTDRDKWSFNHGLFWHTYHYGDADTSTHRTYPKAGHGEIHGGGPSPDQNYTTGLLLFYFFTGDDTARETVQNLAQFVIDADDGSKTVMKWLSRQNTGFATASGSYAYHGPGRGPGNSLNALVDGHRLTGDRKFLDKAEQLIRRVVHPAEDIGRHQLDDPENKWFYLMFLQALGKYLAYKRERGLMDEMYSYGQATLLHYARWMAEHEYVYLEKPERLTFPTETWFAHEIRKSDVFYMAAAHAGGAERQKLAERGAFFFATAINGLESKSSRSFARPVIVLLSSGLLHPWYLRRGSTDEMPAGPVTQFKPHRQFVPQKQIALARAKALVIGGAILVVGALAYFLLVSSS